MRHQPRLERRGLGPGRRGHRRRGDRRLQPEHGTGPQGAGDSRHAHQPERREPGPVASRDPSDATGGPRGDSSATRPGRPAGPRPPETSVHHARSAASRTIAGGAALPVLAQELLHPHADEADLLPLRVLPRVEEGLEQAPHLGLQRRLAPEGPAPVCDRLLVTNPAKRTVTVTVRNAWNVSLAKSPSGWVSESLIDQL